MKRILIILFSLALLTVGATSAQPAPREITFFLTFVPNIQFAPLYVAIEKGYFEEAGINLTIEHGDEPVGLDLIATGARQFGMIGGEQVIVARANGRPVTFVYEWFQQFPVGLVVTENAGIESVSDLAGRRVGVPGRFGASYSGLTALLNANDLTESDVQLEEIGFNAPDIVCLGAIEAATIYLNNEPLIIGNRAEAGECGDVTGVRVFPVADAVDMVSNGIVTNEDTMANDPDLVRAVVSAFDRGLRDVIANPAEAYLLSAEHVEGLLTDDALRATLESAALEEAAASPTDDVRETLGETFAPETLLQFDVLLATIPLWEGETLGYTDPASWETTQEVLISMDFLSESIDVTGAFTNEFLPQGE